MSNLPVREMVLYKHGVGFFVRAGEVEGTSATLTFRADEVNDILKSLAVFDRSGGQVYGVHYQTPMDTAHRLANTSIRLGNKNSIIQLFQQLRGRQVSLVAKDDSGQAATYAGRIIGTEEHYTTDQHLYFLSVIDDAKQTHIIPFANILNFGIQDSQSEEDLFYFLDTSMSEDNRRSVSIRMSDGTHDLVVHYVAPSPTWRVSYRLVAESEGDGSKGTALLQGWGLFDNRLEEDLEDVQVTLVAGQPISFIYDLYASKIPERPVVEDEARVVQKPVEYRSSIKSPDRSASTSAPQYEELQHAPEERRRGISSEGYRKIMEGTTKVETETKETGETFQYRVTTPVTVKRGESALVPILSHDVTYERELLYNKDKLQNHPVASLCFENQTGLTLERGPVTLVEDGEYKGEAIVAFTKDGTAVYVPYAVDLSVVIREQFKRKLELRTLAIDQQYLKHQRYDIHVFTYTIQNTSSSDKVVTIEAAIEPDFELYETREPDVTTLNEQRWHVTVPANSTVEFVKQSRELKWDDVEIRQLRKLDLDRYLENKYIDHALIESLKDVLDMMATKVNLRYKIDRLNKEKQKIYEKQQQLRENMGALGTTGKEGALRQRVVDQLEESQDRLDEIEQETTDLNQQIEDTEEQVTNLIADLGKTYPPQEIN